MSFRSLESRIFPSHKAKNKTRAKMVPPKTRKAGLKWSTSKWTLVLSSVSHNKWVVSDDRSKKRGITRKYVKSCIFLIMSLLTSLFLFFAFCSFNHCICLFRYTLSDGVSTTRAMIPESVYSKLVSHRHLKIPAKIASSMQNSNHFPKNGANPKTVIVNCLTGGCTDQNLVGRQPMGT